MPACIWEDLERIGGLSIGDYTLLNLCLDVHMTCSGASDVLPYPLLDDAVRVLEKARDEWEIPNTLTAQFDYAVLALVNAAIAEGKAELQRLADPSPRQMVTFSEPFEIEMPA